jgi:hypothetical protein
MSIGIKKACSLALTCNQSSQPIYKLMINRDQQMTQFIHDQFAIPIIPQIGQSAKNFLF